MTEESEEAKNKRIDLWMISTFLLAIVVVIVVSIQITGMLVSEPTTTVLTPGEAAAKAVDYINNYLLQPGTRAYLISVNESNDLYNVKMNIGGVIYDSYVTKDGKLLFPSAVDLEEIPEQQAQQQGQEVPKTDKPEVHAFVMSYCPYGLQFIKAYIPVMELLGNKADLELNFVHYAMHGKKELDENTRMYCIQKEQKDKLAKYLRCFVESDDYEECITEAGIDKIKLESCISSTDEQFNVTELYNDKSTWSGGRFPLYPVDADLTSKYGVSGSPTFVINDKTLSVSRSPEAIKQAVCSAFNNPPEECDQTLSTNTESPGIGPIGSGSGSASTGQC